ncbi:ABC transporter permease subunit [Pontiella sp.]|uniref:ABC transporter permease subunit n=1 Tax=Pontiella sp. TaxID=2837462 RepID=UPI003564B445
MKRIKLSPITRMRMNRFKSIKRGYYSFWLLIALTLLSFAGELFINSKALMVKYEGKLYFPVLRSIPGISKQYKGSDFGEDYTYEAKYRELQQKWKDADSGNWVLMPLVPYSAGESDPIEMTALRNMEQELDSRLAASIAAAKSEIADPAELDMRLQELTYMRDKESFQLFKRAFHPLPPNAATRHFLGTDKIGRDILARLVFGYRIAIIFSLILMLFNYGIGVTVGCSMGYFGKWIDLLGQRLIEILSRVPFIYIIMIASTIYGRSFGLLLGLMVLFGWMGATWQMRTATYREKARDYIMAARSLGASNARIIFVHIIPSTISLLVTFIPFSISGSIIGLTSLDFLGFGLPPGTPSWGELMKMGTENMDSPWIVSSVVGAMVLILFLVNLVGEAVREAFDPKKFTQYE